MIILYYDCFAGISGDMNLAAMIDLGVDRAHLSQELSRLKLEQEFTLNVTQSEKMGIGGTKVLVNLKNQRLKNHPASHRNLKTIEKIIDDSDLDRAVKITSKEIFRHVALAEAKVHRKDLKDIHFHEVGATDSIVDIVGAAICYHHLKVDRVMARPIELGRGVVTCAHGFLPVPAPATAEIVKDIPTTFGSVNGEATTPTGAAILKTLVDEFISNPKFIIRKTAYGIGHRDSEIPNVLRVYLADEDA